MVTAIYKRKIAVCCMLAAWLGVAVSAAEVASARQGTSPAFDTPGVSYDVICTHSFIGCEAIPLFSLSGFRASRGESVLAGISLPSAGPPGCDFVDPLMMPMREHSSILLCTFSRVESGKHAIILRLQIFYGNVAVEK